MRIIVVLIAPSDTVGDAGRAWDTDAIKKDYEGIPNGWVDAIVRSPAPHICPQPSIACANLRVHAPTQMRKANETLCSWSYGRVQLNWTIIGPFKTTNEYTLKGCEQTLGPAPGDRHIGPMHILYVDR
tara:strand:- start:2366 stop:2749 length:384 start_codon:yes stop_codon:yes gene_type:complete|eukprot:scaffold105302_cov63-Phaeocystis_antarctica.AAC.4